MVLLSISSPNAYSASSICPFDTVDCRRRPSTSITAHSRALSSTGRPSSRASFDSRSSSTGPTWTTGIALPKYRRLTASKRAFTSSRSKGLTIIVGARLKPLDPVTDQIASGEDDDRQRITAAAKFAQEIQAAPIGQVQIKQQRVIRYRAHRVLRRLQPFEPVDRVSCRANMLLHGRSEMWFVFNQQ